MGSRVVIFTDGACSGNPGPGGWAAAINHEDRCEMISGNEALTTNNRMELMAVLKSVKKAKRHGYSTIIINSDSAYVVNSVNMGWLGKWRKNGWKSKTGDCIKNQDLWEQMNEHLLDDDCNIILKKVKGHSGNTFNEMADKSAKAEVERAKKKQEA